MSLQVLTYSELFTQIGSYIQDTSAARQTQIKDAVNREYAKVWSEIDWPQLLRPRDFTLNDTELLYLTKDVGAIRLIVDISDDRVLDSLDVSSMYRRYTKLIGEGANPIHHYLDGEFGQKADISTAEQLNFVSSNAADSSQELELWGELASGETVNETISLNGTSTVTSNETYAMINRISTDDDTRLGTVTVTGATSSTEYAVITKNEVTARYKRIRVVGNSNNTLKIFYKRLPQRLINDADIPEIPVSMYLFEATVAKMFQLQRKWQPAQFHQREARKLLDDALSEYEMQSDKTRQAVPSRDIDISRSGRTIVIGP